MIDVTPKSGGGWTASASLAIVPAANSVKFLSELQPLPFGSSAGSVRNDLFEELNGWNAPSQLFLPLDAYEPSVGVPFQYTSQSTLNREAAAWHDTASDQWFLYSASTCHPGIWVIPLQRVSGVLDFVPGASSWFTANATMGFLHSIYVDAARNQLWVCEDYTPAGGPSSRVKGVQIQTGAAAGSLSSTLVMSKQYAGPPHDAMPVGDRLFVSVMGSNLTEVFSLPITVANAPAASTLVTTVSGFYGHSCYYNATLAPMGNYTGAPFAAALYTVAEMIGPNFARFDYLLNPSGSQDWYANEVSTPGVFPAGQIAPDVVHHIRGVMRTGFFASYNSGITLASLASSQPGVMGSYDTSWRVPPISSGNDVQKFVNKFDGTWDIYPGADSGMVCSSVGDLGSAVFQVKQGVINRYWNATPFASGAAAGLFPRIIAPWGPPRVNQSFYIEDGNAGTYPTANGTISYRSTLYLSLVDPVAMTSNWVPPIVTTSGASQGYSALDYSQIFSVATNPVGFHAYSFPNMGSIVDFKWFAQMVVEEWDNATNTATGNWAASRGTWIGVAP
ncbi:MAG: hypothetical protein IT456_10485 [Planctomycetes bacterium]|nr:hypothetical protein [Planctomycetota bacterium]